MNVRSCGTGAWFRRETTRTRQERSVGSKTIVHGALLGPGFGLSGGIFRFVAISTDVPRRQLSKFLIFIFVGPCPWGGMAGGAGEGRQQRGLINFFFFFDEWCSSGSISPLLLLLKSFESPR